MSINTMKDLKERFEEIHNGFPKFQTTDLMDIFIRLIQENIRQKERKVLLMIDMRTYQAISGYQRDLNTNRTFVESLDYYLKGSGVSLVFQVLGMIETPFLLALPFNGIFLSSLNDGEGFQYTRRMIKT